MGHRISKVYTRTGDLGTTTDAMGHKVAKNSQQMELQGSLDELNSHLGVLLSETLPADIENILHGIQHQLFEAGAEIAQPGCQRIQTAHVICIEKHIDQINLQLPPLKEFVLPGGKNGAAFCHLTRSLCRRLERVAVSYHQETPLHSPFLAYLNRLSDLFFVMARVLARQNGEHEVLWKPEFSS